MSTTTTTEVAGYAARVRAALADLPPAARDDLVPDLDDHLTEVAAEGELTQLLGSPEAYAAELRASAGLPPAGRPATRPHPAWLRATLDFLPQLRPGWWVLRGLVLAWLGGLVLGGGLLLGLLLAVAAVPGSVVLGRRAALEPGLRWIDLTASIVSALALILSLGLAGGSSTVGGDTSEVAPSQDEEPLGGVTNLFPYGRDGRPLTGVQLYDQDGAPVELGPATDDQGRTITSVRRRTADGRPVDNVYPREQTVENEFDPAAAPVPVPPPVVRPPAISGG